MKESGLISYDYNFNYACDLSKFDKDTIDYPSNTRIKSDNIIIDSEVDYVDKDDYFSQSIVICNQQILLLPVLFCNGFANKNLKHNLRDLITLNK